MKKRIFFTVFLALFFQVLFSSYFRFGNITIDFFLVVSVWAGISFGQPVGVWTGLMCGTIGDMSSYAFFGTNVLSKILVGFLAGNAYKKVNCSEIIPRMFLIAALSLLDGLLTYFILFLSNFSFNFGESFFKIIVPQVFFNAVVGSIFISLILKVNSLFWGKFSGSASGYDLDHLF